jgi:septal ring factor EnvC (AmiA/AmiB activator)
MRSITIITISTVAVCAVAGLLIAGMYQYQNIADEWQQKYFESEKKIKILTDEKISLLETLQQVEERTKVTNEQIDNMRKELQERNKLLEEANKKPPIMIPVPGPTVLYCPPKPTPKPLKTKRKHKRIYSIAPSQQ